MDAKNFWRMLVVSQPVEVYRDNGKERHTISLNEDHRTSIELTFSIVLTNGVKFNGMALQGFFRMG